MAAKRKISRKAYEVVQSRELLWNLSACTAGSGRQDSFRWWLHPSLVLVWFPLVYVFCDPLHISLFIPVHCFAPSSRLWPRSIHLPPSPPPRLITFAFQIITHSRHNFGLHCCRGKSGCIPLPEIPVWEAVAWFAPTTTSFPPPPSLHATSKPSTGQQRDLNALQYTKKWLHVMGLGYILVPE
ncbi:hypothetical protein B0H10DRAFT_2190738 [Mycena sp. CBHHK59/15]|nr:hypothetical protein B0H10DRAFT_2190738 [Mycena sp. CBHHK59/15]